MIKLHFTLFAMLVGAAMPAVAMAQGGPSKVESKRAARAIVLPSVIEDGGRRRPSEKERDASGLLARVDEMIADTAHDLGLATDGPRAVLPDPTTVTDAEMIELARSADGVVIATTARVVDGDIQLQVKLASPARRTLATRTERFPKEDLAVRAVVLLRDVVADAGVVARPTLETKAIPRGEMAVEARSDGRAVLAANATVFGGLLGVSVEGASGSSDPRLFYPLLAVGASVGLGAALLVADEWDVGSGDAWFASSGGIWPTAAAHLIYEGRFGGAAGRSGRDGDRWAFGLVGGATGLTLATLSLALGDMSNGGAVLAHSGGAFGLGLGALTEWMVRGSTKDVPFAGMGYGAAFGWLAAASAATTRMRLSPMRVLSIDLGAAIGGLAGAACASPLLVTSPSRDDTRGFIGATFGGALLGAGVAFWFSRETKPSSAPSRASLPATTLARGVTIQPDLPEIGLLGETPLTPEAPPALGARVRGRW